MTHSFIFKNNKKKKSLPELISDASHKIVDRSFVNVLMRAQKVWVEVRQHNLC